jgi:hypothetical protein
MINPRFAVLVPVAFALAACSIPFVNAGAKPSPTPSMYQQALAYSKCMRSHGVSDFPDPSSNGTFQIQTGPGTGLDPQSATFQNADKACKSLRPAGQGGPGAMSAADKQKLINFSKCMRAHGVPDFPDPTFGSNGGSVSINGSGGSSDLDPNSPAFQAAMKACQSLMPGGGPGTGTVTNGGPNGGSGK